MTEKIIGGRAGSSMRWAFFEGLDIGADGDPYLDRLRIVQTPWFGLYLHHIHRPDNDRDPHDHPWGFLSVILAGSYTERVWPDKREPGRHHTRLRSRWSTGRLGRSTAHIITAIEGPLWTLVLTGPRRADWGFWQDGEFTPWREYVPQQPQEYTEWARDTAAADGPGRQLVREIVHSGPPEGLTIAVIQETMAMHGMPRASMPTITRWLISDRANGLVISNRPLVNTGTWKPTDALHRLLEGTPPESVR